MITHEVFNQSPPLEDYNLFSRDRCLRDAVEREGAVHAVDALSDFGQRLGASDVLDLGRQANSYLPVLRAFDRYGHRQDRVEFHPAYHELMRLSVAHGLHASPWEHIAHDKRAAPGRNVARQAGVYMMVQVEPGHMCPITMTNASVPTLLYQSELAGQWLPRIVTREYDPAFIPAGRKRGVTLGMGMTEKQGGTDVRSNTTAAEPAGSGGAGQEYLLTGHKWFFSAPMCDAFLVLAQAPGGLSCFLMPRFLPDNELNAIHIQRLKEKVGNRSNASSEVEFLRAHAWLIGEEGRGVRTIIEMANWTRLDCAVSSAGMMRQALVQALHHGRYREVFGKALVDQPLMRNVLADMALDVEGCTALAFRVSRAFDRAQDSAAEEAYRRIMTPVAKYWNCKLAPGLSYEAMECMGGNGYVDESISARLYRETPVNAIWEGSGNVMCLDLLRALSREPQSLEAVLAELETARGINRHYDRSLERLKNSFREPDTLQGSARLLVETLAKTAAASVLLADAPEAVSESYCQARLAGQSALYGTLVAGTPLEGIIARQWP